MFDILCSKQEFVWNIKVPNQFAVRYYMEQTKMNPSKWMEKFKHWSSILRDNKVEAIDNE